MNQIPPKPVEIRSGYQPGAIGRIVELHGRYYAREWGVGAPFEMLTARGLSDFLERFDPAEDLFLTTHVGDTLIGSLAIEGGAGGPGTGQVRFVIVDEAYHGRGAGKAMLARAMGWARERGFDRLFLWTVDHLPASRHLYESVGFRIMDKVRDDRYSTMLDSLRLEVRLKDSFIPLT